MSGPNEREFFDTLGAVMPPTLAERDEPPPPVDSVPPSAPPAGNDAPPATPPAHDRKRTQAPPPELPASGASPPAPAPPWQAQPVPAGEAAPLGAGQQGQQPRRYSALRDDFPKQPPRPPAAHHADPRTGGPAWHAREGAGPSALDGERGRVRVAGANSGDLLHEQLRAFDLISSRKIPSALGWRKWLYHLSFRAINVGESADEQEVRKLKAMVGSVFRGTYTVAVLGGKGGAGKTTTAAAIGSMFALLRNDKVVAIDADPAQAANLAARIDPKASSSFREIVADEQLLRYSDVRSHVGQNQAGLDVLASNPQMSGRHPVDAKTYAAAHERLERFYSLLIVDCGVDLQDPMMTGVLGSANAVVMVASAVPDGAEGAAKQIDWLADVGNRHLMSRLVLVINHIRGQTSRKDKKQSEQLVATLVERFSRWVPRERIVVIPFDPHIATAGIVELDQLRAGTRRRFLEMTAAVASGFSTTTDTA